LGSVRGERQPSHVCKQILESEVKVEKSTRQETCRYVSDWEYILHW